MWIIGLLGPYWGLHVLDFDGCCFVSVHCADVSL